MPEREFELYLSLLSRFLKLNPAQRGDVADELRDHLEDRLEELAAQGLTREQAIHKALAEFGDAAELAQHFTRAARIRRRRLIMRCTYGTAAALAATLLIATAFWPAAPRNPLIPEAAAQNQPADAAAAPEASPALPAPDDATAALTKILNAPISIHFEETPLEEVLAHIRGTSGINIHIEKLAHDRQTGPYGAPVTINLDEVKTSTILDLVLKPFGLRYSIHKDGFLLIGSKAADAASDYNAAEERILAALAKPTDVSFQELPLEEAVRYLKDYHDINIILDRPALMEVGVQADTPITLDLHGVTFRSVLKLMLEPNRLTYLIEDEVMKLTTRGQAGNVIRVYDIRDLVGAAPPMAVSGRAAKMTGLASVESVAAGVGPALAAAPNAQAAVAPKPATITHETDSLAELVAKTVSLDTWLDGGGDGSVIQYNGLLVVRNNLVVQDKVREFLKSMRLAREKPF